MNDKAPTEETAQNITELPKQKRSFAWKKYAKYAGYGTAAVLSAVVIFKLASSTDAPVELEEDSEPDPLVVEAPAV